MKKHTNILLQNFGVLDKLYALGFYKFCRLDFGGIFFIEQDNFSGNLLVHHVNLLLTVNMDPWSCDAGKVYLQQHV